MRQENNSVVKTGKLRLSRATISNLRHAEMRQIIGGATYTCTEQCGPSDNCGPTKNCTKNCTVNGNTCNHKCGTAQTDAV